MHAAHYPCMQHATRVPLPRTGDAGVTASCAALQAIGLKVVARLACTTPGPALCAVAAPQRPAAGHDSGSEWHRPVSTCPHCTRRLDARWVCVQGYCQCDGLLVDSRSGEAKDPSMQYIWKHVMFGFYGGTAGQGQLLNAVGPCWCVPNARGTAQAAAALAAGQGAAARGQGLEVCSKPLRHSCDAMQPPSPLRHLRDSSIPRSN
jgi:hypothetical protein